MEKSWQGLLSYWRPKHRDGIPPSRNDIDPIDIPALLSNVMLIDLEGAEFRLRLVGSDIVRRVGRDSTGRLFDRTLFSDDALADWLAVLRKVVTQRRPVLYGFDPDAVEHYSAIGLIVPLVGNAGKTEMLLTGVFFDLPKGSGSPKVPGRIIEIPINDRTVS